MGLANTYEEARKQRLEENRRKFQDLGIANISKSLINSPKKYHQGRPSKPKEKTVYAIKPRRSSRARNQVSYQDDGDIQLPGSLRRSRSDPSSWASYIARPLEECRTASYAERMQAFQLAEEFQSNLQSQNPSFVKSMVRSHVYSCFWLGLPSKFCNENLPKETVEIVLEDEKEKEYDSTFIGKRVGLSGGWRAFALEHKLNDGDALVFELIKPTRFKVYMFRVSQLSEQLDTSISKNKKGARKRTKVLDSGSSETSKKEAITRVKKSTLEKAESGEDKKGNVPSKRVLRKRA